MGMSASQARMLSLTARMSDLEYSAQSISNSKLTLATQSEDASKKYLAALDQQKLTVKNPDTSAYVDASAYNLTTYNAISKMDKQRFLKDNSGALLVTSTVAKAYKGAESDPNSQDVRNRYKTLESYLNSPEACGYHDQTSATASGLTYDAKKVTYFTNVYNCTEAFLNGLGYSSDSGANNYDASAAAYYSNLYNEMAECGYTQPGDDKMKDPKWLYEQLNNGAVCLSEWDADGGKEGTGDFVDVSWSSGDATLAATSDKEGVARAEAEYETTLASIQTKDKRFDMQLKSIDTEHTAIQTEIDSVKKVIDKNIERTFKIFNA